MEERLQASGWNPKTRLGRCVPGPVLAAPKGDKPTLFRTTKVLPQQLPSPPGAPKPPCTATPHLSLEAA